MMFITMYMIEVLLLFILLIAVQSNCVCTVVPRFINILLQLAARL